MAKNKKKFYAVGKGRKSGVYETWAECEAQTKGFSGAKFKSFSSKQEAQEYIQQFGSASQRPSKRQKVNFHPLLTIEIYFDGGARGNPGVAGAGATVGIRPVDTASFQGKKVQVRQYLGTNETNNVAEYQGLICGLREAKDAINSFEKTHKGAGVRVVVRGDSDLIIQQMQGTYQCKSANLTVVHNTAKDLVTEIESISLVQVEFQHVYRKDNSEADALANEAMDTRNTWKTVELLNDSAASTGEPASLPAKKPGVIYEDV